MRVVAGTRAVDAVAAVAVAVCLRLFFGDGYPDYDALWNLLWGDDLVHGRDPQLDLPFAPAAHPLYLVLGALVAPLGDGAADALRWLVLLATGAVVVGIFRLGQELVSWPVGLAAALILLTREPTLYLGQAAFVDLPAAALVIWAAVLEARTPRRGAAVLVLLGLAGLLRPELWLLAGVYWLWLAPPLGWAARARGAALVAAGPLLWALTELVLTGDPLRPLTEKNASLAAVGSQSGLGEAPGELTSDLGGFLQAPALALAVVGGLAGLAWLPRRVALPLAIGALNVVAFVVLAASDQPLEQRYLFLAAAMGALLAAVGALGWMALAADHPLRPRWRVAGYVALVAALAVSLPNDWERAADLREDVRLGARIQDDLRDLLESGPAGEPIYVQTARPVPFVAFWSDLRPGAVISPPPQAPGPGLLVVPTTGAAAELLGKGIPEADGPAAPVPPPPAGWRPLETGDAWALLGAG